MLFFNYSIRDAAEDKFIKDIDAVLTVDGDEELTKKNNVLFKLLRHIKRIKPCIHMLTMMGMRE